MKVVFIGMARLIWILKCIQMITLTKLVNCLLPSRMSCTQHLYGNIQKHNSRVYPGSVHP